jgi:hypothetical protein
MEFFHRLTLAAINTQPYKYMSKKTILGITFLALVFLFALNSCKKKSSSDINISKSEALEIAKKYDLSGDSVKISFNTYVYYKTSLAYKKGKRKLFYWEVSKDCNHCSIIQIDAVTGKVIFESKNVYVY